MVYSYIIVDKVISNIVEWLRCEHELKKVRQVRRYIAIYVVVILATHARTYILYICVVWVGVRVYIFRNVIAAHGDAAAI